MTTRPDFVPADFPPLTCPKCKGQKIEFVAIEERTEQDLSDRPWHLGRCTNSFLIYEPDPELINDEVSCDWAGPIHDTLPARPINQGEAEAIIAMWRSAQTHGVDMDPRNRALIPELIASQFGLHTSAVETLIANADAIQANFVEDQRENQQEQEQQQEQQDRIQSEKIQGQINRLNLHLHPSQQPPHVIAASRWAQSNPAPSRLKLALAPEEFRSHLGFVASDGEEQCEKTRDMVYTMATMYAHMDGFSSAALTESDMEALRILLFHEHRATNGHLCFGAGMEMWVLAHRTRQFLAQEAEEKRHKKAMRDNPQAEVKRILLPGQENFDDIKGAASTDGFGNPVGQIDPGAGAPSVIDLASHRSRRGTGRGR